jgi:serine phosphatase RsbU (regulator of sigma subunit)
MVATMNNTVRQARGVGNAYNWPGPGGNLWDLQSWSRPADAVGGDFIEAHWRGSVLRIWVADVTGHGFLAARLAGRVRRVLRRYFAAPVSPDMLRQASAEVYRVLEGERFLSVTVLECDTRTNRVTILNAGNPPVVVYRQRGSTLETAPSSGMPLGLVSDAEWQAPRPVQFRLAPGDQLLCFTDGLTDEPGRRGRFGLRRVIRAFRRHRRNVIDELAGRLAAFSDQPRPGLEQDDVTVLCLERQPGLANAFAA